MNNNRYGKLFKNTIIFSVGSFGSKLLNFLIVPLYTFFYYDFEFNVTFYNIIDSGISN